MRNELNIPVNATVFGRHGGKEQFNIPFVHEVVYDIAKENPNIYFLFVNTDKFCKDLPNIIYLDAIVDLNLKRKFINTCDAMIWARTDGETFGLAIAEFSICNKPVIATNLCDSKEHVNILKNKGLWYNNRENLIDMINMLTTMDKKVLKEKNWNAYSEYTPEKVMKIFHKVAIEPFNF
jgi:glycosyltransferase involved in cell wall biosynthesis